MKRFRSTIAALPLVLMTIPALAQAYEPSLDTPFNVRSQPPKVDLPKTPVPNFITAPVVQSSTPSHTAQPTTFPSPSAGSTKSLHPEKSVQTPVNTPDTTRSVVIDRSKNALPITPAAPLTDGDKSQQTTEQKPSYVPGQLIVGSAKAYDGHSLLVNGHPIRLDGIEAPGLSQTCFTSSMTVWRCGNKALELIATLVRGERVSCTVTSAAGHGAAAICSIRGIKDLGAFLVQEGFAIPNKNGQSRYTNHVISAQTRKSGIWTGSFEDPGTWRKKNTSS